MNDELIKARAAVKEIQQWIDEIAEMGANHFGEMDEAMEAYLDRAETFFELYDEAMDTREKGAS